MFPFSAQENVSSRRRLPWENGQVFLAVWGTGTGAYHHTQGLFWQRMAKVSLEDQIRLSYLALCWGDILRKQGDISSNRKLAVIG